MGILTVTTRPAPTSRDVLWVRDLIYRSCGIFHTDQKLNLVERACVRRIEAMELESLSEYCDFLQNSPLRRKEVNELLNEITIGETCFFRNQPQLDALRDQVLPAVMKGSTKLALKHLRIWSAGCSTGEEPYTLAILLTELSQTLLRGWTFEVLATDLNARSIETALAGVYSNYSLRNISPLLRQKYFTPCGGSFDVKDEIRAKVKFDQLNLMDSTRMLFMKSMDVIFCGNVLIYFDLQSKKRVIDHFYSNLLEGGYFFLGHSESLFGVDDRFKLVQFPNTTGYLKPPKVTKL